MRVLLIEDDRRLAASIQRGLGESGLAVDLAYDGDDGIAAALSAPYDVLVMDVMLPGTDGLSVSRQLRQQKVSTPILMLTARDAVDDRVSGLEAGADDYMVKPFAVVELLARVRALARRGARSANGSGKLRAGDLTLDVSRHSAVRDDVEIELTVKEFQLLELMLRHQGQVLTRSQILDHVWAYDRDFSSNVVDIYVHYLRNKVDKGFDKQLIHTVRGVGYTLKP
jgi:DNA-binding response OmpR family regulator